MIAPNSQHHPIARIRQAQFAIRLLFARQLGRRRFDLHVNARVHRTVLRRPANFTQRHQLHVDPAKRPKSYSSLMTPQAIRAPELPAGSVFKSSSFSCTTTDFPMIESLPLKLSFPVQFSRALPEPSASILPRSPA